MKISVWTKSAYKIRVLQSVISELWFEVELCACAVPSWISEQPMTSGETKQGSINRAIAALEKISDAEISCAIEFGYEPIANNFHCIAYACIVDQLWNKRIEHSSSFKLPRFLADWLKEGKEMSDEVDVYFVNGLTNNLKRSVAQYMRKEEFLRQAYHAVLTSYFSDQIIFNTASWKPQH